MGWKLFLFRKWRRITGRTPYPLNEDLDGLKKNWDLMAARDPCYAICTVQGKGNRKWNHEEFFATGREEIKRVLDLARKLSPSLKLNRALDFGCGIGRLSHALARHFTEVDGIDISDEMLRNARLLHGNLTNVRFQKNESTRLPFESGTFNFVYSNIVLQHMKTDLALAYIREFVRVLAPGGFAIFQAPSRNKILKISDLSCPHDFCGKTGFMEMHGHPMQEVEAAVSSAGGRILEMLPDTSAGEAWESFLYVVTR